jgi:hypothetical protein
MLMIAIVYLEYIIVMTIGWVQLTDIIFTMLQEQSSTGVFHLL